jgi:hypothetical protein
MTQLLELKCNVVGGHHVEGVGRLSYGETFECRSDRLTEAIEGDLRDGQIVIEDRTPFGDPRSTVEVSDTGSSSSEIVDRNTAPPSDGDETDVAIDSDRLADLLEDQRDLLSQVVRLLESKPSSSITHRSSSDAPSPTDRPPETSNPVYVPDDIGQSDDQFGDGRLDVESSESSSGNVDQAAEALESMQQEVDSE